MAICAAFLFVSFDVGATWRLGRSRLLARVENGTRYCGWCSVATVSNVETFPMLALECFDRKRHMH
jgi:hypothetical protein